MFKELETDKYTFSYMSYILNDENCCFRNGRMIISKNRRRQHEQSFVASLKHK